MMDIAPILHIAGIAAATWFVEFVLEKTGHGDKNTFVRIVGHGTAAVYALNTWFRYLRDVASMFGVLI
jgi:hypothetical protein